MTERPLVSVVVLNYEGEHHLAACLGSLTKQTYDQVEIVVADNGSSDRSEESARRHRVRWEPLGFNHGFSLGNNLAVERCTGEIVVFVNNDMRFDERFVEEIIAPLLEASDPPVFAVDARQLSWIGDSVEHGATRLVRAPWRAVFQRRSCLPGLDLIQDTSTVPTTVVAACGSAMAVRKTMFDELGGFDSRLPAGWEDIEICWRAGLRGWSSRYAPSAFAWHKIGASSMVGEGAAVRLRGALGGRLLFVSKHLPMEHALTGWLLALGGLMGTAARGRMAEARVRWATIVEAARLVPYLREERRRLYRSAATTPRLFVRRQLRSDRRDEVLFVLGRRDEPTDGVEDYCKKLGAAVAQLGAAADLVRIPWAEQGVVRGVARAFLAARGARGVVNLQFTQLSWSRRGVSLRAVAVAAAIRLAGADLSVTFHDPTPFAGNGATGWARARLQELTMTALASVAQRGFVTVDPACVKWASRAAIGDRLTFLPVGTNVDPTTATLRPSSSPFTIVVFGVTEGPRLQELDEMAEIVNRVGMAVEGVRLSVFGRGAERARPGLEARLEPARVNLVLEGLLDEDDVSRRLANADVMLFLRGTVSSRRTTVIAAIAHGLPIVGYCGPETARPIDGAGLVLVAPGDVASAATSLIKIASDGSSRDTLARLSADAHSDYFRWDVLAAQFLGGTRRGASSSAKA